MNYSAEFINIWAEKDGFILELGIILTCILWVVALKKKKKEKKQM